MPFLRNKIVKIITIVIVTCAVLSGMAYFGSNPVQRALYTVISPVFNGIYSVVTPVRQFVTNIKEAGNYEKEIKSLKEQVNALSIENKSREDYINENKRLKELLDLKDTTMAAYDTVTARVVSYEPNSWYDTVMLDKGEKGGISVDDIVITSLGVVGRVTDCGSNWSKVSTIINASNSVGIKLSRTGDVGVLSGDASLAQDKNAKLEYLSNDKNLIKGDILVTSGLGGVYPANLTIGKIINIRSDSAGNLDYGVVEPSVDFSSLYEVLVITGMKEGYVPVDDPIEVPVAENTNNDANGEVIGEQITE
ncbi:MAG: rod shape-determining protein MreC [Clostridia bacterium]|nr:rod shape-determining protein MreC [Clostridia bacterium]